MSYKKLICVLISVSLMACQPLLKEQVRLNQAQLSSLEERLSHLERELQQVKDLTQQTKLVYGQKFAQLKMEQKRLAALLSTPGRPSVAIKTQQTPSPSSTTKKLTQSKPRLRFSPAEQLYHKALTDLRQNKNALLAQKEFQAFIQQYPKSILLPNAYYWLGECEYAQKQFVQAIIAFKEVSNRYPHHPKAADALLKMGFAYEKLGDLENARFYLQKILDRYPQSHASALAKNKLAKLNK